jgi:hypothetical protein
VEVLYFCGETLESTAGHRVVICILYSSVAATENLSQLLVSVLPESCLAEQGKGPVAARKLRVFESS